MKYIDWRDLALRAGKTLVQGAVGVLVTLGAAGWTKVLTNLDTAKTVGIAVAAAALAALTSFVWNLVFPPR